MNLYEDFADRLRRYRLEKLSKYSVQGVISLKSPLAQLELLDFFGPNVKFNDITDDTDLLPPELQSGKGQTSTDPLIFAREWPFKAKRIYEPRVVMAPTLRKEFMIGTAQNVEGSTPFNLNGNALTLTTNHGDARYKRFIELCMVFWSDTGRTTKETSTTRTITLTEIVKPSAIDPSTAAPTFRTTVIQYQATATVNPTHQTAGDLIVTLDPLYLPRLHELQLSILSLASNVYVDAWIVTEVLN